MHKFYKLNYTTFVSMLIALLLCIPLLSVNTAAKAHKAKASVSLSVSSAPAEDAVDKKLKASGLVNLSEMDANLVFEQRYATTNNFTGKKLYNSTRVYLRPGTAKKLVEADKEFNSLGYKIKIWDAYRPMSVQYKLYAAAPPDRKYFIANPYSQDSCIHNRGAAVDITLVHMDGSAVEMPTDFDTFDYSADIYSDCSKEAKKNRKLLRDVMQKHGFTGIECEWWHFNDTEAYKYSIIDVMF